LPSLKQAFAIHLLISLIIFLILLYLLMRVWYPGELFYIDGGLQGLKIIAPVDLVLGPALTLILYRPWKKSLAFDMSVVALIQILALGYGVYSAHSQRTAAIVFAGDSRFETISLKEMKTANKEIEALSLQPLRVAELGRMPALFYVTPFEDFGKYLEGVLNGQPELRERSDRYIPLDQAFDRIVAKRVALSEDGEIVEIPASGNDAISDQSLNQFKIKARYEHAIITLHNGDYEIQRIGH
jgi:hypothetical protein